MKNVVVTGAAGGMGLATCRRLVQDGYSVWGMDKAEAQEGWSWRYIQADLTDGEAVEEACRTITAETGELCAIIHMAGMYDLDSLVEMSEEDFVRIFSVNLFGVYRVNRALVPALGKGGRVIITSSELAPLDPLPFTGIYGITKTALEKYAYSLRMELQLLGYRVSVIRPGAVRTGLLSVSTDALERFCEKTGLYKCNAVRFRKIVDSVESRNIPPERIAKLAKRALTARRPRYVYNINRNPLLRLLNILPQRLQTGIIRLILK